MHPTFGYTSYHKLQLYLTLILIFSNSTKKRHGYSLLYQSQGQDRRQIVFGLSCLCGLNCLGLPAFIYFGQVPKCHDAFRPPFLCSSNLVTPVFHHESTSHLLLDTNSVYIIQFVLVGDWFVQQTANKPQTQWGRDLKQI